MIDRGKEFYVYAYLDPDKSGRFACDNFVFDHEPFYIGKGCGDRITHHSLSNRKHFVGYKLGKLKREGKEPIRKKLFTNLTEEDALLKEMMMIAMAGKRVDGTGPLTNLAVGGDLSPMYGRRGKDSPLYGIKHTKETRRKMSISAKKSYENRDQWNKGKKNWQVPWNKGKTGVYSEETLRKKSISGMGKKHTEESKKKMSFWHRNSPDKKLTVKKWVITLPNGKEIVIRNMHKFCRENNLIANSLRNVLSGVTNNYKGYKIRRFPVLIKRNI